MFINKITENKIIKDIFENKAANGYNIILESNPALTNSSNKFLYAIISENGKKNTRIIAISDINK